MNYEKLYEAIRNVKNGTCTRIGYTTSVPLKAKYKDKNISIKKIVSTTARLGVRYNNIKSVKERQAANAAKPAYKSNNTWVINNKVKYNLNTGKTYLVIATFPKGDNTKVCYEVNNNGQVSYYFSKKELESSYASEFVINSYFNKGSATEIYNVNIDNIFKIGKEEF